MTADRDLALDGLRGVAILLVIGVHLRMLGCGWAGVQLFFVLSGFLITRILVAEATAYPFREYLARFYVRRALRILPVLYLYLALIGLIAWLQDWGGGAAKQLTAGALFFSNYQLIIDAASPVPAVHYSTGHLWSLAVEEHFYLFWPLVVFAARKRLHQVILLCLLAGPLLRWAGMELFLDGAGDHKLAAWRVYIASTSHLDAFAAGALVSLWAAGATEKMPRLQIWLGFGVLVYALGVAANGSLGILGKGGLPLNLGFPAALPESGQYVWGYTLLNLFFAQLVLLSLRHPQAQRLLSFAWLRFTGRISYGLYLVHFPIVLFVFFPLRYWLGQRGFGEYASGGLAALGFLGLSVLIAWLSFRYFEMPVMQKGRGLQNRFARRREREPDELAPQRA